MSLIVPALAIWLIVIPVVVMGGATLKTELDDRRHARELDRWLAEVLSDDQSGHHKKAPRAAVTAGTLTQRSSTSYERL